MADRLSAIARTARSTIGRVRSLGVRTWPPSSSASSPSPGRAPVVRAVHRAPVVRPSSRPPWPRRSRRRPDDDRRRRRSPRPPRPAGRAVADDSTRTDRAATLQQGVARSGRATTSPPRRRWTAPSSSPPTVITSATGSASPSRPTGQPSSTSSPRTARGCSSPGRTGSRSTIRRPRPIRSPRSGRRPPWRVADAQGTTVTLTVTVPATALGVADDGDVPLTAVVTDGVLTVGALRRPPSGAEPRVGGGDVRPAGRRLTGDRAGLTRSPVAAGLADSADVRQPAATSRRTPPPLRSPVDARRLVLHRRHGRRRRSGVRRARRVPRLLDAVAARDDRA